MPERTKEFLDWLQKICESNEDALIELGYVKQKKGEWLEHPFANDWKVCSVCGRGTQKMFPNSSTARWINFAYCPHCAAKLYTEILPRDAVL